MRLLLLRPEERIAATKLGEDGLRSLPPVPLGLGRLSQGYPAPEKAKGKMAGLGESCRVERAKSCLCPQESV